MKINFTLNGCAVKVDVGPTDTLTDVLRQKLGILSVKKGCETGDCGACAVLVDGKLINSCITLAPTIVNKDIITAEGLMINGEMDIIQKRIAELHGTQCGFCTPGMIIAIKALLSCNPHPSESEIRRAISGNLCRCTGYQKIVEAVQSITE